MLQRFPPIFPLPFIKQVLGKPGCNINTRNTILQHFTVEILSTDTGNELKWFHPVPIQQFPDLIHFLNL